MAARERTRAALEVLVMSSRRQFLFVAAGAVVAAPALVWVGRPTPVDPADPRFTFRRTNEAWHRALSDAQYRVLREGATERPFSSVLNAQTAAGTYVCAGCGHASFSSAAKYDSGEGWPSFWTPLANAVVTDVDRSWFMIRTEVRCAACGSHLGHLFDDGPRPTGLRYCINGIALRFVAGDAPPAPASASST
jgi:peptide-methionine (R)-S-oxide reductase